jgi:hypothetical protein
VNIKTLLLGTAVALASSSSVFAADAIVAADPEAVEYVRVCDSFGAGFFYIPGSETCLKIGGYVRAQASFGRDAKGTSDWDNQNRVVLGVDARSDSELGTVRSYIALRSDVANGSSSGSSVYVEEAFISFAGLSVGKMYSEWDNDLAGETDILSSNANFNTVRYSLESGGLSGYVAAEELEGIRYAGSLETDNNVGVSAQLGGTFGPLSFSVVGSYDVDQEEGAIRGIVFAESGPGTLGVSGVWSSGVNAYYDVSEWTVAAEYAIRATDRLTVIPAAQYLGNVSSKDAAGDVIAADWSSNDAWKAGVTVNYKITEGLTSKATVNYYDEDGANDEVTGFLRLQRNF